MPTYLHLNCREASCSLYGNFYVHVYLHAPEKKQNEGYKGRRSWSRFQAKGCIVWKLECGKSAGKVLEKWASYSPQMAINLPDAESNSLAV